MAGLYGLLGYVVAMRAGEIGIRAALGATAADSILLVLKEAGLVVACGLAVGAPLAWLAKGLAGRVFAGLESPPAGPLALAAACVLLLVVLAACAPALRAARIDPMQALRRD
jgi:ABC-type antimicrobial peptide transport system permease subunit